MRRSLITTFFFGVFLFSSNAVFGCVCDTSVTFAESFKEASAVFSAKFVSAEYRKGIISESIEATFFPGNEKRSYEVLVLKFQVEQSWKGAPKQQIVLLTNHARFSDGSTSVSDCDLLFNEGKRYLIFAYGAENRLQTSACSRTARLEKAKKDLKLLGAGKKPRR
jgi:hypothetical protein